VRGPPRVARPQTRTRYGEAAVAGITGENDLQAPRHPGDRRGADVVLAGPGVGEPDGIVPELGHDPGTENDTQARLAGVDVSVRVPPKMSRHHLAQSGDLLVQRLDQRRLRSDDGGVGGLDRGRLGQPRRAQQLLDLRGSGCRVTALASTAIRPSPSGSPTCSPRPAGRATAGPGLAIDTSSS
jgi:hypothetical protein